jgi:uncharacterized protein
MSLARIPQIIAAEIGANPSQVVSAVELLDGGATVPFVARYRKEVTGGLDDTQLRKLEERLGYLRELEARRAAIVESITGQGKMTEDLAKSIAGAGTKAELEDIYLPYKPKRRTKAMIAREAGLQGLVDAILADRAADPAGLAGGFLSEGLPMPRRRWKARATSWPRGCPRTRPCWAGCATTCARWGGWSRRWSRARNRRGPSSATTSPIPSPLGRPFHRVLAMLRGRNEDILSLDLEVDAGCPARGKPGGTRLRRRAWRRECGRGRPLAARGRRLGLAGQAEDQPDAGPDGRMREARRGRGDPRLCPQPQGPAAGRAGRGAATLGLDPGIRTGVKVAVVDATGKVVATDDVYPFQPKNDLRGAQAALARLIAPHGRS